MYMKKRLLPKWLQNRGAVFALAFLLCASFSSGLSADSGLPGTSENVQQNRRTVTGKVVDESGNPVVGATVTVPGTAGGTTTLGNGSYSIPVPAGSNELKFSFLGYQDVLIPIDGKTVVDVVLRESATGLDEVVVVGYGAQRKATLTGAVETIGADKLESRAVTNVGLALQGQTPGLVVTRTSPRPGNEGLSFQIRGATSVNGGSPLVVVDGVPTLNYMSFQNMNADDIESISVLKDGEASIYGSRAANGVILVTTKRGKGKVSVDYNFNMRFTTNGITAYSPNMMEYATMWLEANKEEKTPNWWGWVSEENMLSMQQGIEGIYTTAYWGDIFIGDANRIDEMFARRYSYQHNLSVSGSDEKSSYRISAEYADNQGNLATAYDGQKQYNFRTNYDYKLGKRIKLESIINLIKVDTSTPSVGLDSSLYGQEMPFYPAKNPYGQWYANYGTVGDRQPVAATSDGGREDKNSLTARLDLKGTIDIWNGISFEAMASFQNEEFRSERWVVPVQCYDWFGNPTSQVISATQTSLSDLTNPGGSNPGYRTRAENYFYQYYSALLKYNGTFNEVHNISVTAGINAEKYENRKVAAGRLNFEDDGVYDINLAENNIANSGGKSQNGRYSYLATINYDYAGKYLVKLIGRRDGNSKFADGYKFKNFGSASLGWVFTGEKFLEPITKVLNFGKIRLSCGSMGNDVGIVDFNYVSLVNRGTRILGYPATSMGTSWLSNNGLFSNLTSWEKVEQKNIGVDLHFLNSRLTASFDYFIKDNKGMLVSVNYPSILGGTAPKTNNGHLNVKGWEVAVNWRDRIRDFNYYVSFNISDNKTLLKSLEGATTYGAGKTARLVGRPLNAWHVYQTDGYFTSQTEIDAYYEAYAAAGGKMTNVAKGGTSELRPGDIKIVSQTGKSITPDGNENSDLVYKGDGNIHYTFGLTLGGDWKGFDLNMMFQGVGSQKIMRGGWMAYPFATLYTNQNPNFLGKTWTESNTNADYPRLSTYTSRSNWNYVNNDFMLQNSRYSWIRVTNHKLELL